MGAAHVLSPDPPPGTDPLVSVVVPTHQRRDATRRLLDALARQTLSPTSFEVVIAIDGSADGTEALIETYTADFSLRWLWQPQRGRAAACNAGARLATGDLLVLLDDDMEPPPQFLAAHLAAHPPGSRRGVVGAAPIARSDQSPPVVAYRARMFDRKLARLAERPGALRFSDVYTGNFSIPRGLFFLVDGFDEEFRLYGHEDYELVLRLMQGGVEFVYDADALAVQHYTKSFRSLAANVVAEGQTATLFARKHPEIFNELPLSRFAQRSAGTRRRLRLLLDMSRRWSGFSAMVVYGVERLERRRPANLETLYNLAFDYLYWHGVERGLAGGGRPRKVTFHEVEREIAGSASNAFGSRSRE